MTDISDKALEELESVLAEEAERLGGGSMQRRWLDAITALRAELKAARKVTREQLDKQFRLFKDFIGYYQEPAIPEERLDDFVKALGLEIVEEAPKAEERECDCSHDGHQFYCVKDKCLSNTRCTITEGGRDETR